jgi:hypothetical protein
MESNKIGQKQKYKTFQHVGNDQTERCYKHYLPLLLFIVPVAAVWLYAY